MKYLLTMTTNGRRDCFLRTLDAFLAHVRPHPVELYVFDDGDQTGAAELVAAGEVASAEFPIAVRVERTRRPAGFCRATRRAWTAAAVSPYEWAFHLEDDFEVVRGIDLRDLATVLHHEPRVAQMALMRDAVNEVEKAAGGLYESRRGDYERRGSGGCVWLEHRAYWTTNPSLFRTSLPKSFPWPTAAHCEGEFGIGLRMALPETTFGVWGDGSPWVTHTGERVGHGY